MSICIFGISALESLMHFLRGKQNNLRVVGVFVYQDVFKSVFQPFTIVL